MTTPDPALTSLLGQWKAAIQAATPGPWKVSSYGPGALLSPTEADGEFIALARGAMPLLVAAVEAVLGLADKLEPQASPASALEEDRMWIRQQCAEMIREAITRELTAR